MVQNGNGSHGTNGKGSRKASLLGSLVTVFRLERCSSLTQMLKLTSLCSRCHDTLRLDDEGE